MTLAAVDRLAHHATIFDLNVESFRSRSALEAKRLRGRPATFAAVESMSQIVAERQSKTEGVFISDNISDNLLDAVT